MEADYEDKFVLKYGALEQDYEELQEATQEVISQLQIVKETKLILRAELSFLRKRVKILKENASTTEGIRDFISLKEAAKGAAQVMAPAWASTGRVNPLQYLEEGYNVACKPLLPQSLTHGSTAPQTSSKNREVVGVLKTSSLKYGANGFPQPKKTGKRKISWQDEFTIKA